MGIRGFTSFVDSKNSQFLQSHNLHDTRVVIDGNNFYHFLYHLDAEPQYGGDYDIYYNKVQDIFQTFAKCNIQPFVVLDGGHEADNKKLTTVLTRAEDRIKLASQLSRGNGGRVLPLLAEETFKQVLIDLAVSFVVCDYEADTEVVTLANQWQCPVMSNDSDFFVFDLKGGFILFDYADFRMSSALDQESGNKHHCLPVQIYYIDNFVKVFPGFEKKLLPVIAILLGNDFIASSVFENFFASLKEVNSKSVPKRHKRLMSIINWLENFETCEKAVGSIIKHLPINSRENLRSLILKCIGFYTDLNESFSLSHFFDGNQQSLMQCTENVKMYNGTSPPSWFVSAHRSGTLNHRLLSITILHRAILLSQVENMKATSAYSTSESIRQVTYGILLKDDSQLKEESSANKQTKCVIEYSRDEYKNLKKTPMRPVYCLTECGQLPGLSDVLGVPRDTCVQILLEVLSVPRSLVELFSPPLQLLVCVTLYWITHSQPKVMKHHYHALLVCIISLQAKDRIRQMKIKMKTETKENLVCEVNSHNTESISDREVFYGNGESVQTQDEHRDSVKSNCGLVSVQSACEEASEAELTSVVERLDKFHDKPVPITHSSPMEPPILHGMAQFQACFFDTLHLNKLLQSPLDSPQPHTFFNGVFMYNFTKELKSRVKPMLYITDALVAKSPLVAVFEWMDAAISEYITDDVFQDTTPGKKNKRKNAKKKKKKKGKISLALTVEKSNSESDSEEEVQAACDLDNRFASLLLVDE